MCYARDMSWKQQLKQMQQRTATLLRLATAFCLFALSVLQGLTFCLCRPDPDACGAECHDCTSLPDAHLSEYTHCCEHLALATLAPGRETPDGIHELLNALLLIREATRQGCQVVYPLPTVPFLSERPPGVQYPQLTFIARSTQILC